MCCSRHWLSLSLFPLRSMVRTNAKDVQIIFNLLYLQLVFISLSKWQSLIVKSPEKIEQLFYFYYFCIDMIIGKYKKIRWSLRWLKAKRISKYSLPQALSWTCATFTSSITLWKLIIDFLMISPDFKCIWNSAWKPFSSLNTDKLSTKRCENHLKPNSLKVVKKRLHSVHCGGLIMLSTRNKWYDRPDQISLCWTVGEGFRT